jgi:hypothetical protein
LLVAMLAAAHLCRWRYRPGRFMLWLGAFEMTIVVVALFAFFLISVAATSSSTLNIWAEIPRIISMGLILGLGLYLLTLPFMILGFANPFFRDRLRACLSLRAPKEPSLPVQVSQDGTTTVNSVTHQPASPPP